MEIMTPIVVEKIKKEIRVMVNGAIRKVTEENRDFAGFAMAIPAVIRILLSQQCNLHPELSDKAIVEITEQITAFGKQEIMRFFTACNVDIRQYSGGKRV